MKCSITVNVREMMLSAHAKQVTSGDRSTVHSCSHQRRESLEVSSIHMNLSRLQQQLNDGGVALSAAPMDLDLNSVSLHDLHRFVQKLTGCGP